MFIILECNINMRMTNKETMKEILKFYLEIVFFRINGMCRVEAEYDDFNINSFHQVVSQDPSLSALLNKYL